MGQEMTIYEVAALFEGLVRAEERRLRVKYPRGGRFTWELGNDELHVVFIIRKRKLELFVGKMIEITSWYANQDGSVDDYVSDYSSTTYTQDEAITLAHLLQTRHFPLLENSLQENPN